MKKKQTDNEPLERLFETVRDVHIADNGFSRRVIERIEPLPPSRNFYRVPTFATAFASVLVIVWIALSGFKVTGLTDRFDRRQTIETSIRLVPLSWTVPRTPDKETRQIEHAND